MTGERIGVIVSGPKEENYELTEFLGAGSFGEVYRAEYKEQELIAAVKILPLGGISDATLIQSLMNEAALATQVSHPNVVNVFHVGDNEDIGPYILMEYISGQTLEEFLRVRTEMDSMISLGKSVEIMLQIAQGAQAINEQLVHRDIKPDNILFSGDRLKITDFGLSKLVAERTRTKTFKGLGPISYMAPEAWQLQPNTPKMDVYSVGLIYYEILALHHPLISKVADPSHIEAWRQVHLFEQIEDIRDVRGDIPRPLSQLLSRMVAKRADDRPEWNEIIEVLSSAGVESETSEDLAQIIEKAITRRDKTEKKRLEEEHKRSTEQELEQLYQVSFQQLVSSWDKIVYSFNEEFQGDAIRKFSKSGFRFEYHLPKAPSIQVVLYSRRKTDINIAGGNLIGGGFIGIERGLSANILLIQKSPEDIYGQWLACLMKLHALVDPQKSLSHLSSPPHMEPFGFSSESDFYEHIRGAGSGGMHIFTYELKTDLDQMFRNFLDTAFSM